MSTRAAKKRKTSAVQTKLAPSNPFYQAIVDRDIDAVGVILDGDSTLINKEFADNHYPITLAAAKSSAVVVAKLLAAGANTKLLLRGRVYAHSQNRPGAIQLAAAREDGADIIQILNIRGQWMPGDNPVVWAAVYGRADNVRALHKSGTKPNGGFYDTGSSPLNMAIKFAPLDKVLSTVIALVEGGEEILDGNPDKHTTVEPTLNSAAKRLGDMSELVRWLLQRGCGINARIVQRRWGPSALHDCAEAGSAATMRTLISCGADVNLQDNDGRTPLHIAIMNPDFEKVRVLLEAGANELQKDKKGETAVDYLAIKHATSSGLFSYTVTTFRATAFSLNERKRRISYLTQHTASLE